MEVCRGRKHQPLTLNTLRVTERGLRILSLGSTGVNYRLQLPLQAWYRGNLPSDDVSDHAGPWLLVCAGSWA